MIQNYKRLGKFSINIRWRHSFIAMQDTCDSYCQNGGTCSHSPNGTSRSCTCGPRFSGETCETDLCADQCVANQGKQILFFCCLFCLFFLNFRRTWLLLAGALIPLFRTSADISSGFENQCGSSLACFVTWMQWSQIHLWRPAWQPSSSLPRTDSLFFIISFEAKLLEYCNIKQFSMFTVT